MTTTVEHAAERLSAPAQRLARTMAAVRVSFTWLGVRKTLSRQQKQEAAESFGAEGEYLSAAKKLLDTSHPAYKAVTAVRNRAISYWRAMSLPYPEPGVRLIRQDRVEAFDAQMRDLRDALAEAVAELDQSYDQLRSAARSRLGRLYNPADYPPTLRDLFAIQWDFPSVQPPDYLLELNPRLYEQEQARIAARFEEAVKLAEEAFTSELSQLLSHLLERLRGDQDGAPKVFRNSAVANLNEFFQRFRSLNVRSSPQLDELVEQAKKVITGVGAQDLRENSSLRQRISTQLAGVQSVLDGMMLDQPRRRILRTSGKKVE
jgi:hypothetical protein